MKYTLLYTAVLSLFLTACSGTAAEKKDKTQNDTTAVTKDSTAEKPKEAQRVSPTKVLDAEINGVKVKITYGSPSVKKREIWGKLVPYDEVWRTGANESTTIETDKDALIGGKKVAAGKYGFFTIPGTKSWTIIINSVWDQWGSYTYDRSKDVVRFTSKPETTDFSESLEFTSENGKIWIVWEKLKVPFEVKGA
jgi:hypothetical protein